MISLVKNKTIKNKYNELEILGWEWEFGFQFCGMRKSVRSTIWCSEQGAEDYAEQIISQNPAHVNECGQGAHDGPGLPQ